jgi:methylglutaconyl-CoA hydratase
VEAVGLSRARYLFFTAAEIDAHAAGAMGLVGEVVPHAELDTRTEWILEQISSTGPLARATIKRDLNAQLRPGDVSLFMTPGLSAEITEGMGAFVEKRAAVWPRP